MGLPIFPSTPTWMIINLYANHGCVSQDIEFTKNLSIVSTEQPTILMELWNGETLEWIKIAEFLYENSAYYPNYLINVASNSIFIPVDDTPLLPYIDENQWFISMHFKVTECLTSDGALGRQTKLRLQTVWPGMQEDALKWPGHVEYHPLPGSLQSLP